jgi:broad specificity phosphatase PhoE
MKTIYFIRHTQSEANLKDILASRQDFPLTEKGRQEAVAIASEFKDIAQLDRIFCSPLIRAQQTAQPIAEAFGGWMSKPMNASLSRIWVYFPA